MNADWTSWTISLDERSRYESIFQTLNPTSGFLTDITKDGKLDRDEFSIAMFLIKKTLEGHQLPQNLPLALISPNPARSTPPAYNEPISAFHQPQSRQTPISPVLVGGGGGGSLSTSPAFSSQPHDWCVIKQTDVNRYRRQFVEIDQTHRGFVTGIEAKKLFSVSRLPQSTLINIWTLSDLNVDGNLSFPEFTIASFLIEAALAGRPIPTTLPPTLLPANHPRQSTDSFDLGSPEASKPSPASFENKRRENFLQGQIELEKRQQELAEQLRREEEDRLEKERLERERQEQLRQEREKREALRASELEAQRDVARRQAHESMSRAWRAAERDRLLASERQRVERLEQERSQVKARLELARSQQANLAELANTRSQHRVNCQSQLASLQQDVDQVKSNIDGMRLQRDKHHHEIAHLNERIESTKAELAAIHRQRDQLAPRLSSINGSVDSTTKAEQCKTLQASKAAKLAAIDALKSQLTSLDNQLTGRGEELALRRNKVEEAEMRSARLRDEVEQLTRELAKHKLSTTKNGTSITAPSSVDVWSTAPSLDNSTEKEVWEAVYPYQARHPGELSLKMGMKINVHRNPPVKVDPEWLYGTSTLDHNQSGLFPEAYARRQVVGKIDPFDPFGVHKSNPVSPTADPSFQSTPPPPIPVTISNQLDTNNPLFVAQATFAFNAEQSDDIDLQVGDLIDVSERRGEWLMGYSHRLAKSGLFPANHVRVSTAMTGLPRQSSPPPPTMVAGEKPGALADKIGELSLDTKSQWTTDFNPPPLASAFTLRPQFQPPGDTRNEMVVPNKLGRVISAFKAGESGQLTLEPGQIVLIGRQAINDGGNSGWYQGELQQRGRDRQLGWFPTNCVELIETASAVVAPSHIPQNNAAPTSKDKNRMFAIHELLETERDYLNNLTEVYNMQSFDAFRTYCRHHHACQLELNRLTEDSSQLRQLIKSLCGQTRSPNLPFHSYLLKPVQRIVQYKMLIERIVRYTTDAEDHDDLVILKSVLLHLSDFLTRLNQSMSNQPILVLTKRLANRISRLPTHVAEWLWPDLCNCRLSSSTIGAGDNASSSPTLLYYGWLILKKYDRVVAGFLFDRIMLLATPKFRIDRDKIGEPSNSLGQLLLDDVECKRIRFRLFDKVLYLHQLVATPTPLVAKQKISSSPALTTSSANDSSSMLLRPLFSPSPRPASVHSMHSFESDGVERRATFSCHDSSNIDTASNVMGRRQSTSSPRLTVPNPAAAVSSLGPRQQSRRRDSVSPTPFKPTFYLYQRLKWTKYAFCVKSMEERDEWLLRIMYATIWAVQNSMSFCPQPSIAAESMDMFVEESSSVDECDILTLKVSDQLP